MVDPERVLERARNALRGQPRVDAEHHPIALSFADGILSLDGEVDDVVAKKLALRTAAAIEGVSWVVDRLRVHPAAPMGDAEIADHVRDAFLLEPVLSEINLSIDCGGRCEIVSMPANSRGEICIRVEQGIVTLDGELPSRAHKRLAALLPWWIPGTRDVIDGLAVVPHERDNDDEITDAVRIALEKDPLIDASQIRVRTRRGYVSLRGLVRSDRECEIAERDAWCVLGVVGVDNLIEVRPS